MAFTKIVEIQTARPTIWQGFWRARPGHAGIWELRRLNLGLAIPQIFVPDNQPSKDKIDSWTLQRPHVIQVSPQRVLGLHALGWAASACLDPSRFFCCLAQNLPNLNLTSVSFLLFFLSLWLYMPYPHYNLSPSSCAISIHFINNYHREKPFVDDLNARHCVHHKFIR